MIGIYVIRCMETNHCYVGQTTDHNRRWNEHKSLLRNGKHNERIQAAHDEHGMDSLRFAMLEPCKEEQLNELERKHIDFLRPEFNISEHYAHLKESRIRASEASRKRWADREKRNKMISKMKGNSPSDESRRKMRDSQRIRLNSRVPADIKYSTHW